MWRVIGWVALSGGVVALLLSLGSMDKAKGGPYRDVAPGIFVPPEWKWTYRVIALLWSTAGTALVLLGSYLLPDVRWLEPIRPSWHKLRVSVGWPRSIVARLAVAVSAMWDSIVSHVSGWFWSIAGITVVLFSHWLVWDVVFCVIAAVALEVHYEFFRLSKPKLAYTERHWWSRGADRTFSAISVAALLFFYGLYPAVATRVGWNWAAQHAGWPMIAPLNPEGLLSNPGDHVYFKLKLGWSALGGILLALWCRRKPLYDLFLSYKSQDAQLVREVADRLISGGVRVWLAEYEVPLRREARFLRYIGYGIRRSRFGLAFTHDLYAKSPYCIEELEGLLRSCGPRRTLRVKLEDLDSVDSAFQGIEAVPVLRTDGNVGDILTFVERQTGFKAAMQMPAHLTPTTFAGTWRGRPYKLDTTGWEAAKRTREGPSLVVGPTLHYIEDPPTLLFNLDIRDEDSEKAWVREGADDREMYKELKKYVPEFLGALKTKARGIHLFFHSGMSQMAVTYWAGGQWRRKYSVILQDPERGSAAEFMFTFGVFGTFRELCAMTPVMEVMVQSLEWK